MILIFLGFHGMMTKVKTVAFDLGKVVISGWLSGDFVVLDQARSCSFGFSYFSDFCG